MSGVVLPSLTPLARPVLLQAETHISIFSRGSLSLDQSFNTNINLFQKPFYVDRGNDSEMLDCDTGGHQFS